jgi:hypothetical protein
MFCALEFFETMTPMTGKVILGDGKTSLEVKGIGTIKMRFGDNILPVDNVRYVPDLAESIYSLFLHIQHPDYAIHSSFDDGLSIIFRTFTTKALIGQNDIYLDAVPIHTTSILQDQVDSSLNSSISSLDKHSNYCHHVMQFQNDVASESKKVDNLLCQLRQYYQNVKTRRQLDLEVSTGFRQQSQYQQHKESTMKLPSSNALSDSDVHLFSSCSPNPEGSPLLLSSNDSVTNSSSKLPVPILRCVDKPSSSLPSRTTYTEDFVHASVGFHRIDSIKTHF